MMPRGLFYWIQKPSESHLFVSVSRREDFAWTPRCSKRTSAGRLKDDESELLVDDSTKERSIKGRRSCKVSPTFYQHYQPLTHEVVLVPVEPNELLESQVGDGFR
jgi:hypothetical protein